AGTQDWCRQRLRLAPGLVEDVTQTVLLALFAKMQAGRPHWDQEKGHLHPWLKRVVHNACHDALAKHRPAAALHEGDRACADFAEQVARAEVLRLAGERAQERVGPVKWEAFRLLALEGLGGGAAARQTGLGVGTVYNYASEVRKVFHQELTTLGGPDFP